MDQLIKLLKNNARITNSELAVLLDKQKSRLQRISPSLKQTA